MTIHVGQSDGPPGDVSSLNTGISGAAPVKVGSAAGGAVQSREHFLGPHNPATATSQCQIFYTRFECSFECSFPLVSSVFF
jgi:hypothetical protein